MRREFTCPQYRVFGWGPLTLRFHQGSKVGQISGAMAEHLCIPLKIDPSHFQTFTSNGACSTNIAWTHYISIKWSNNKKWTALVSKNHSTQDSRVVPHRGTNWAALRLTAQIGRDAVLSKSYGRGYSSYILNPYVCHLQCGVSSSVHWLCIETSCDNCDQTSKGRYFEPSLSRPPTSRSAHLW